MLDGSAPRVAFHWHGVEGEARAVTYAELHRDVQRFANRDPRDRLCHTDIHAAHGDWPVKRSGA